MTVLNVLDAHRNSLDFVGFVVVIAAAAVALLSDTWHSSLQVSEKGISYADSPFVRIVFLR